MDAGQAAPLPPAPAPNPSRLRYRLPAAFLALAGLTIATYLALFQYEVISGVWDPFFGPGSERVLTSSLSRALPVRDSALGAAAYLAELVLELSGGRRRWHERPWLVLLTGAVAAALGVAGIGLVIAQPVLTGTFCTLCLCSAAVSLMIAALVWREVAAAVRLVAFRFRAGQSLVSSLR